MAGIGFPGGLLRVCFSYSVELLLSRTFKPFRIKAAFPICAFLLFTLLTVPHLGKVWLNGLYDFLCVGVAFPIILLMAASGTPQNGAGEKFCRFLGDVSYPVYVAHYPIMYLYYHWVWNNGISSFRETLPQALAVFFGSLALAYLVLKVYDEP